MRGELFAKSSPRTLFKNLHAKGKATATSFAKNRRPVEEIVLAYGEHADVPRCGNRGLAPPVIAIDNAAT